MGTESIRLPGMRVSSEDRAVTEDKRNSHAMFAMRKRNWSLEDEISFMGKFLLGTR